MENLLWNVLIAKTVVTEAVCINIIR